MKNNEHLPDEEYDGQEAVYSMLGILFIFFIIEIITITLYLIL